MYYRLVTLDDRVLYYLDQEDAKRDHPEGWSSLKLVWCILDEDTDLVC
jgi:hypothetical protein